MNRVRSAPLYGGALSEESFYGYLTDMVPPWTLGSPLSKFSFILNQ